MANGNWKSMYVPVGLVVLIVGAAIAYGVLYADVEHIKELEPQVKEHDRKIIVLETRQEAIYKGVERLEQHFGTKPKP